MTGLQIGVCRALGLLVLVAVTACATGRQQTSRQLEEGERMASAWVDGATWMTGSENETSTLFTTARLGGQYTRAVGDLGDVSYHLSTSHLVLPAAGAWILDAGVTGRWYPSELLTAGLQLQTGFVREGGNGAAALAALARVATTTTSERPYYGAAQVWTPVWVSHTGPGVGMAVFGVAVGMEIAPWLDGPTVQVELAWTPLLVASGPRQGFGRMMTAARIDWPLTLSVGGHWQLP